MEHPKDIGDRTTLAVMLALRDAGYVVSVPFGENSRYDLLIDDGTRIARVQCKSGQLVSGVVRFKTASSYAHHRTPRTERRHYQGQIDFFAVYCRGNCGVYLVPIDDVPTTCEARLRIDPPRNNQRKRIRDAAGYQVATVEIPVVRPTLRASAGARGSSA
jgi:PD-(D/E)XK endonuclease